MVHQAHHLDHQLVLPQVVPVLEDHLVCPAPTPAAPAAAPVQPEAGARREDEGGRGGDDGGRDGAAAGGAVLILPAALGGRAVEAELDDGGVERAAEHEGGVRNHARDAHPRVERQGHGGRAGRERHRLGKQQPELLLLPVLPALLVARPPLRARHARHEGILLAEQVQQVRPPRPQRVPEGVEGRLEHGARARVLQLHAQIPVEEVGQLQALARPLDQEPRQRAHLLPPRHGPRAPAAVVAHVEGRLAAAVLGAGDLVAEGLHELEEVGDELLVRGSPQRVHGEGADDGVLEGLLAAGGGGGGECRGGRLMVVRP